MKFWAGIGIGISKWLATRAASFWIMGIAGVAIAALVFYIQQGRVCCAKLEGINQSQVLIDSLTEEVKEGIDRETDEDIRAARQTPDECLSTPMPDELVERLRD